MLLRKCLSQAGAQGQLPLVCSCALQLVQDRLVRATAPAPRPPRASRVRPAAQRRAHGGVGDGGCSGCRCVGGVWRHDAPRYAREQRARASATRWRPHTRLRPVRARLLLCAALAAHPAVASSQAAARLPTAAPAPLPALATTSVQERQQMVREEQLLRARTYTVHGHAALACTSLLTVVRATPRNTACPCCFIAPHRGCLTPRAAQLQVSLHPAAPPARDGVASATGAPVAIALRVSADDHSSLRAACQLAGLLASTNPQLRETMALAGAAALLPASGEPKHRGRAATALPRWLTCCAQAATAAEEAVTAEASAQRDALTELRRALSDIPSSPRRSAHTCALRILLAARAAFPVFVTGEPTWALAVGTVLFERAVVREQAVEAAALAEEVRGARRQPAPAPPLPSPCHPSLPPRCRLRS